MRETGACSSLYSAACFDFRPGRGMNVFPIFLSPLLVIGAAFFTVRLMPFLEVTHHSLAPSARAVPGRKPRYAELSAPSHRSDRKAISVGIVHLSGQLDPRPIAFVGSCERCRFSFSFPLYRGAAAILPRSAQESRRCVGHGHTERIHGDQDYFFPCSSACAFTASSACPLP
jgi:hypothetical protein